MNQRRRLNRVAPFVLALLIGAGFLGVWGFVIVWSQAVIGTWLFPSRNEGLEVTADGRALVRSMHRLNDSRWATTYRTLAGQEVDELKIVSAPQNYLSAPPRQPLELGWIQRVVGFADLRAWPTYWYEVRDRYVPGRLYFALFDSQSKEAIGYFGPNGFLASRPPAEEQFAEVPSNGVAALSDVSRSYGYSGLPRAKLIFLIAAGKLWQIDMSSRNLAKIDLDGEPIAVESLGRYSPAGIDEDLRSQLLVRTERQILRLDQAGKVVNRVEIPAPLQNKTVSVFSAYKADVPTTVLTSDARNAQIYWLAAGAEPRHTEVQIGEPSVDVPAMFAWFVALVVPSPAPYSCSLGLMAYGDVMQSSSESFGETLAKILRRGWPAIVTLWFLSALLALVCYRHHQRYSDREALAWAVLVFLFGLPGAVGYWLHRTWPVRENCPSCRQTVPRDRAQCLACAVDFPQPALLGIEILS